MSYTLHQVAETVYGTSVSRSQLSSSSR